jgi:hypothetical protein
LHSVVAKLIEVIPADAVVLQYEDVAFLGTVAAPAIASSSRSSDYRTQDFGINVFGGGAAEEI